MIPKEVKYNLHYGDIRGAILPPPHGTNTSCSVVRYTSKDCLWKRRTHYGLENGSLGFIEILHKELESFTNSKLLDGVFFKI